jgi:putative transcriptional regulator
MSEWEGRLLVATPVLTEGTFSRSVVQLLQHAEEDGALGVVLTRPSGTPLAEVLPGWALLSPDPVMVFEGGPVQQTAAICLGRLALGAPPEPSYVTVPGAPWLGTVDLDQDAADAVEEVRVFAGYAGWSPGQLEAEVEEGAWWVLDALPGDCFSTEPEQLWRQVLRRQGMPLALAASYPADPALN